MRLLQYPVALWDPAHARTAYREAINPRPVAHAAIAQLTLPGTIGFGAYSEGVNDDVAKAIWTAAGWYGSTLNVTDALERYARLYMGTTPGLPQAVVRLVASLELNWVGPLADNHGVNITLALADEVEGKVASPRDRANWRLQQLLYRARYDAYVQRRLGYEDAAEVCALSSLADAPKVGSEASINAAVANLQTGYEGASRDPILARLRGDMDRHGAAIFTLSGAQMSVPLYNAINTERGATLDTRDVPLNNAPFLQSELARIRNISNEDSRLTAIAHLVGWSDPGVGGYYDDLGVEKSQPHLVLGPGPAVDPGFLQSALSVFARMSTQSADAPGSPPPSFPELPRTWATLAKYVRYVDLHKQFLPDRAPPAPRSVWFRCIQSAQSVTTPPTLNKHRSMNASPLQLKYDDLPPSCMYNVTIVYGGPPVGLGTGLLRLTANGVLVHDWLPPPDPMAALTFEVPAQASATGGTLLLNCTRAWTDGTSTTGCAVAEVWLRRIACRSP